MERKEQRVGVGVGAFHNPPRAQYSEETRSVIKLLMEESKLSMMQRKSIQQAVDRGESLPPPSRVTSTTVSSTRMSTPCYWKKRSHETIINSGAYDREPYRQTVPLPNKEKQKRYLACLMAFGKDMPETPHGPRILHKARNEPTLPDDVDPLRDLVQGIRERMEFLNDMEKLGQGKKYRPIIHQEIAEKMRIIESMDCRKSAEIASEIVGLKYIRPPPKPFPMGELDDL